MATAQPPVIACPWTCRCEACRKRKPAGYVHGATRAEVDTHIRLIEARERASGVRKP